MSKIIIITDDTDDYDDDDDDDDQLEDRIEAKEFTLLVKKIERYVIDSKATLQADLDSCDLFDLTLKAKLKQVKFLLHPKLSDRIHKRLIDVGSVIKVTDYDVQCDETKMANESFVILKDFEVVEFQNTGSISLDKISYQMKSPKKDLPIITARSYYVPLYNDADYYGDQWRKVPLPITNLSAQDQSTILTIQQLSTSNPGTYLNKPSHGTVITKSRLTHFAKADDTKSKFPYSFTVEIEHGGLTCCVSFWNTACSRYFTNINVGDNILIRNYRVKKRFGTRSNTVYFGRDSNMELSINPYNPKGEIELLQDEPSSVPYRYGCCIVCSSFVVN